MQKSTNHFSSVFAVRLCVVLLISMAMLFGARTTFAQSDDSGQPMSGQRVVTIYDQGEKRVVLTRTDTVEQTLQQAGIELAPYDRVEPSQDTKYATRDYTVNIYRAHPVTVVDGSYRQTILTARSVGREIAEEAGLVVQDEDSMRLERSVNLLEDGPGMRLTIERATPVTLMLYGEVQEMYTQAATVGEFLEERAIMLDASDTLSVDRTQRLERNMTIEIWRDGVQTVTVVEPIDFSVRQVLDSDQLVGHREVDTPGVKGAKNVVYEIVRQDGVEIERRVIQEVVTAQPREQIEVVGNKTVNPLTPGMGVNHFTDSNGVVHRETYYDLPMNVVMNACGGGAYTVREDGAKVDGDGYVLIAAHLGNYPRCSIVETSMGLGKVYDTGTFTQRHPHGFDLATDWTKRDGI